MIEGVKVLFRLRHLRKKVTGFQSIKTVGWIVGDGKEGEGKREQIGKDNSGERWGCVIWVRTHIIRSWCKRTAEKNKTNIKTKNKKTEDSFSVGKNN